MRLLECTIAHLFCLNGWPLECRFFTVVRPGDTVNVIGDFDSDGKCIIDRKNNLLIVHPDVLISGSKVIVANFIYTWFFVAI